uniref:Uncharacterized protein n=1 Tax=Knipowitschia caucasica TaxID=637954 RepID=A0AAV2J4R4_KNICA
MKAVRMYGAGDMRSISRGGMRRRGLEVARRWVCVSESHGGYPSMQGSNISKPWDRGENGAGGWSQGLHISGGWLFVPRPAPGSSEKISEQAIGHGSCSAVL